MSSFTAKSTESVEVYTGDLTRKVVTYYKVRGPADGCDEPLYIYWYDALDAALECCPEMEAELRRELNESIPRAILCDPFEFDVARADWLNENGDGLLDKYGYGVVDVQKYEEKK